MESLPVVMDISSESDEEPGQKSLDYDWLKEFLDLSDKESDDSDEVIVVGEVQPERKSKSTTPAPAARDLDDDCVVLDGDPENRFASVNEPTESDELLIVGETGQIACRDYPHSRHLCAKFPFSSTPHENHCEKCHCYVCDLPAPCLKWGTGVSITDHCHATEKVERWKALRKAFKLRMSTPSPCIGHPQQNQVLPLDISRLSSSSVSQNQASRSTTMRTCSLTNPIPQNHDSWLTIMRACSSSLNSNIQNLVTRVNTIPICSSTSNSTVPNGTNHGRYQESVSTLIRNRYNPHLVSRQLLGVRNNAFQKDRRRSGSSLSPQFSRFRLMSRGVGNGGGTLAVNHSTHGSSGYSNHINPADQYGKYLDATGLPTDRTCNVRSNVDLSSFPLTSIAQPSLNNRLGGNTVASVTQAYYEPSHFENSQNFYHSGMLGDNATSTYVACQSNNNQHGNGHQIGNHSENGTEAMVQCRRSSLEASHQEPLKENQRETARKEDFSEVDLIWNEDASQFIESLFQGSNIQSTESINQPPNGKQSDNLHDGSTCLNSLVDFENWLMEKDVASPCEIPLVDSGTLKGDFDTSWNGLTHA